MRRSYLYFPIRTTDLTFEAISEWNHLQRDRIRVKRGMRREEEEEEERRKEKKEGKNRLRRIACNQSYLDHWMAQRNTPELSLV